MRAVISEGEKSFTRRKFTTEEKEVLKLYLPFFEVEKRADEQNRGSEVKAKL